MARWSDLRCSPWAKGMCGGLLWGWSRQLRPTGQLRALTPAGETKHPATAGQTTEYLPYNHCQPQQCVSHTEAVSPVLSGCEVEYWDWQLRKLHEEKWRMCCFLLLDIAVLETCWKIEIVMLWLEEMSSCLQIQLSWHFTLANVVLALSL